MLHSADLQEWPQHQNSKKKWRPEVTIQARQRKWSNSQKLLIIPCKTSIPYIQRAKGFDVGSLQDLFEVQNALLLSSVNMGAAFVSSWWLMLLFWAVSYSENPSQVQPILFLYEALPSFGWLGVEQWHFIWLDMGRFLGRLMTHQGIGTSKFKQLELVRLSTGAHTRPVGVWQV